MPFPPPMHESESEVSQSCPTLRDPMDCSPPGSSVHGIFQARVLEWGAIAFSLFLLIIGKSQPRSWERKPSKDHCVPAALWFPPHPLAWLTLPCCLQAPFMSLRPGAQGRGQDLATARHTSITRSSFPGLPLSLQQSTRFCRTEQYDRS